LLGAVVVDVVDCLIHLLDSRVDISFLAEVHHRFCCGGVNFNHCEAICSFI